MSIELLAELLIYGMPVSTGIKTVAFLVLWYILWKQESETTLGRWINRFFFFTSLTSFWITYLSLYLTTHSSTEDVTGPVEWSLIIGINVLPVITTFCGYKVAVWTRRTVKVETKNERDVRQDDRQIKQDAQQIVLDATSMINTKRGKYLSEAGVDLDEKRFTLHDDQAAMDNRGHAQDDRQVEQDDRQVEQDQHDKDVEEKNGY